MRSAFVGAGDDTYAPTALPLKDLFFRRDLDQIRPFFADDTPEGQFYSAIQGSGATVDSRTSISSIFKYPSEVMDFSNRSFSEAAKNAVHDIRQWEALCGERYVSQAQIGADFLVNLRVDLLSPSEPANTRCRDWLLESGIRAWTFLDIKNSKLNVAQAATFCPNAKFSIVTLQRGGDPSLLPKTFIQKTIVEERGLGEFVCSVVDLKPCQAAVHELLVYMYGRAGFPSQLDETKDVGKRGGLNVRGYVLAPYSSVGIFPGK